MYLHIFTNVTPLPQQMRKLYHFIRVTNFTINMVPAFSVGLNFYCIRKNDNNTSDGSWR